MIVKEKISTTTLKATPNIESRVKLFCNKTTAIAGILQVSGFVWNHKRCTHECEKSAYEEYVKVYTVSFSNYAMNYIGYLNN